MLKFFLGDWKSVFLSFVIIFLGVVILFPSIIRQPTGNGLIIFIAALIALLLANHLKRKEREEEQSDIENTFE